MKFLFHSFLLFLAIYAYGMEVAYVYSSWPNAQAAFRDEYDEPVAKLGWNMTKYENIRISELTEKLSQYQLIIFGTVCNLDNTIDFAPFAKAWRTYIEAGGVLFVSDANYDTVTQKILNYLGPEFNLLSNTCIAQNQPSPEHSRVTFTNHPLHNFPAPVIPLAKEIGHWAHFHSFPDGWEHLEYCFDKVPLTMARTIGQGLVILSTRYSLMKPYEKEYAAGFLCNIMARQALRANGLELVNVIPPPNNIDATGSFTMTGPLEKLQSLVYHIDYPGANGEIHQEIKPEITGTMAVFTIPIKLYARKDTPVNFRMKSNEELLFNGSWTQKCPPLMQVKARRVNLYPDDPTFSLFVDLAPDCIEEGPYTIVFTLDGLQRETRPIGQVEEQFSLDVKDVAPGTHTVCINLQKNGQDLASFSQDFTLHAQKAIAHIAPDGTLYLHGKPFLPMGFYHVSWQVSADHRLNMVRDIAKHGFNCVHISFKSFEKEGNDFTDFLDECHKLGIYVIPEFGCDPLPVITKYKDHPAILGWDPGDEPEAHGHSPEEMFQRYSAFKALDPNHIVYTVICTPTQYKHYASGADVLAPDPYPIPSSIVDYAFGRYAEAFIEARKYGTTLWSVPQAFGNYSGWGRQPTADEYTVIVYLSLMAGAKGYNNFTYYESTFFLPEFKELYEACLALPGELKNIQDFILSGERKILQQDNCGIYVTRWTLPNRTLYVVINTSTETTKDFAIKGDFSTYNLYAGTLQTAQGTKEGLRAALEPMKRAILLQ